MVFLVAILGCTASESAIAESEDSGAADVGEPPDPSPPSHGPYVTAVSADGATIWARWPMDSSVRVFLSDTADFAHVIVTEPLIADGNHDYAVHWSVNGLGASSLWYYTVAHGDGVTPEAVARARTFRTFPAAEDPAEVTLVFLTDSKAQFPGTALTGAAAELPALAVQLGDFDHRNPGDMAIGKEAWWAMNRENLFDGPAGADLDAGLLRTTPFTHMWDDHDYGANNAASDAVWHDDAVAAFLDYFPLDDRPSPELGLWTSTRLGPVEVFVLDLRSLRDPFDQGDEASRTILGTRGGESAQLDWLSEGLRASTAPWKVVVSTSLWNPTGKRTDSWTNYPMDRALLLEALSGVGGVMFVSGDIHSGGGIDDGTHSWVPELTVPAMNMHGPCTGGADGCGTWSVGLFDEADWEHYPGYGVLRADATTATLEAHGADGSLRVQYTMSAPE